MLALRRLESMESYMRFFLDRRDRSQSRSALAFAGDLRDESAADSIDSLRGRYLDSRQSGCNSVVECQLPKLDVAGSTPVARSTISPCRISGLRRSAACAADARSVRGSHFLAFFWQNLRELGGKLVS